MRRVRGRPTRAELTRLLERAGAGSPPPPRPNFVNELDVRLRRAAADGADESVLRSPVLLPARRRPMVLGAAAAAVTLLVAAIAVVSGSGGDDDRDRVATRPSGPPSTLSGGVPVTGSPVTVAPDDGLPVSVPPSLPGVTVTTAGPTGTTATTATSQPSSTYTMQLTATRDLRGVHLSWTTYTGPRFARYLCLMSESPEAPTYPAGSNTRQVWQTDDQAEDYYLHQRPPSGAASYLMVAVDANGNELARSNIARVGSLGELSYDTPGPARA